MDFELKPLPYAKNALEPHLGSETLTLHHDKHHAGYLHKLEELIGGTPEAGDSLESILQTASGSVFDNAAQVWNHDFLWRSMAPEGGGEPEGDLADAIDKTFGSYAELRKAFLEAGAAHFGSGWLWLECDQGRVQVTTTHDADLPLRHGRIALVTADLWEHAYYLDHRNDRARYLETFIDHLIDWEFAAANWTSARATARDARRR